MHHFPARTVQINKIELCPFLRNFSITTGLSKSYHTEIISDKSKAKLASELNKAPPHEDAGMALYILNVLHRGNITGDEFPQHPRRRILCRLQK
jgi:hypothetical protein